MFTIPNEAAAYHVSQSTVDSTDIGILTYGAFNNGVVAVAEATTGCVVTAQGTPNMTVAVAAGLIKINNYFNYVDAGNVTITTADSTNPRLDLICVTYAGVKSCVAGTAAAQPACPAIPANSIVLAQVYIPASGTTITTAQIVDKRIIIADTFDAFDEFLPSSLTNGQVGEIGWSTRTASVAVVAGTASHPGVLSISSTDAIGSAIGHGVNARNLTFADFTRFRCIVALTAAASNPVLFGLLASNAIGESGASSQGSRLAVAVGIISGSSNWQGGVRNTAGAGITGYTSGIAAVSGDWVMLDCVRTQTGTYQFALNGVKFATATSNLPTSTAPVNYGFGAENSVTTTPFNIDFFGINWLPSNTQRWT